MNQSINFIIFFFFISSSIVIIQSYKGPSIQAPRTILPEITGHTAPVPPYPPRSLEVLQSRPQQPPSFPHASPPVSFHACGPPVGQSCLSGLLEVMNGTSPWSSNTVGHIPRPKTLTLGFFSCLAALCVSSSSSLGCSSSFSVAASFMASWYLAYLSMFPSKKPCKGPKIRLKVGRVM